MSPDPAADLSFPKGWQKDDEGTRVKIRAKTKDFMSAVALIHDIAEAAEQLQHHPDLHLTGYNNLEVLTYSHDVGTLTSRDVALAEQVAQILDDHAARVVE